MAVPSWPNRVLAQLSRLRRRRTPEEQQAHWDALAAHGEALERLMASSDWPALAERIQVAQRLRDLVLHSPTAEPEARARAAIEWNVLADLLRELSHAVSQGRQARLQLAKLGRHAVHG